MFATIAAVVMFVIISNSPNTRSKDPTQWNLPNGAKARLGKGCINEIQFSPRGTYLAVASSMGIWIYDAYTGQEIDLFKWHKGNVYSPDGKTIASGSHDGTILLW